MQLLCDDAEYCKSRLQVASLSVKQRLTKLVKQLRGWEYYSYITETILLILLSYCIFMSFSVVDSEASMIFTKSDIFSGNHCK